MSCRSHGTFLPHCETGVQIVSRNSVLPAVVVRHVGSGSWLRARSMVANSRASASTRCSATSPTDQRSGVRLVKPLCVGQGLAGLEKRHLGLAQEPSGLGPFFTSQAGFRGCNHYDQKDVTASSRSSLVSRARYTSPMPPWPIRAVTSYGPSGCRGFVTYGFGRIITSRAFGNAMRRLLDRPCARPELSTWIPAAPYLPSGDPPPPK